MSPLAHISKALVRCYQVVISPLKAPCCRYYPTCSHYALEAIQRHGAFKGGWLAFTRIIRCAPWGGHGFDYVPGEFTWRNRQNPEKQETGCANDACSCAHEAAAPDISSTPQPSSRISP